MEIAPSAHRHGVTDHDMRHAVACALCEIRQDEDRALFIGPARDGTLLEVVVLEPHSDDPAIIHAMRLRPKFHRYLPREG